MHLIVQNLNQIFFKLIPGTGEEKHLVDKNKKQKNVRVLLGVQTTAAVICAHRS